MSAYSNSLVREPELCELLVAAKAGSAAAIGRLLDEHRDYLLAIAGEELTRNGDCALSPSDVVQWTNLEVCRDLPKFGGTSLTEFRVWLRRILLHNIADSRRRTQRPQTGFNGDVPSTDLSPSHQIANDDATLRLCAVISGLPDDERRVIELRYFDGRSYAEIAKVIGRTPEATRKLWVRAIARLRTRLRPELEES